MTIQIPEFRNMTDLTSYLGLIERRLKSLEAENADLKEQVKGSNAKAFELAQYVKDHQPNTAITSPAFLVRAFAVWGHYAVAQLIVGGVAFVLYLIVFVAILGPAFAKITNR